jgi:hypothetical protein
MTTSEFRSERGRCLAIKRIMEMAVFKQMLEAIFSDLDLNEMYLMNHNLANPTPNVEIRLQNQRKGHQDLLHAMKMCCEPEGNAPEMPLEDYGAGEEAAKLMTNESTWQPFEG